MKSRAKNLALATLALAPIIFIGALFTRRYERERRKKQKKVELPNTSQKQICNLFSFTFKCKLPLAEENKTKLTSHSKENKTQLTLRPEENKTELKPYNEREEFKRASRMWSELFFSKSPTYWDKDAIYKNLILIHVNDGIRHGDLYIESICDDEHIKFISYSKRYSVFVKTRNIGAHIGIFNSPSLDYDFTIFIDSFYRPDLSDYCVMGKLPLPLINQNIELAQFEFCFLATGEWNAKIKTMGSNFVVFSLTRAKDDKLTIILPMGFFNHTTREDIEEETNNSFIAGINSIRSLIDNTCPFPLVIRNEILSYCDRTIFY